MFNVTLNRVVLQGNIGEPKFVNGVVTVGVPYSFDKKVGEVYETQTTWNNVKIFGKDAEQFMKFAKKGTLVNFECRLSPNKYEKDGATVYSLDVVAGRFTILTNGKTKEERESGDTTPKATVKPVATIPDVPVYEEVEADF